jgi:hypothetical protein
VEPSKAPIDQSGKRSGAQKKIHSRVLTVVRSSNLIVRRTGRCGNTPARVAPMQGVAA